ncbi:DUF2147 domain-containing protein [Piscirickettsia litoralis]|uniref:DUF2147 domain-containing protein n=1 Tax=Piscirickettsia litoralis TaxID=1891921 RepID=A0ABX3A0E4_9GAMM|nr:DUF2147 domain-containing protein [Piscirickettsia litoralis]ODN42326.1 hypothetical protein BGC07_04480 [Piscirickettsia litoralis]
MKHYMKLASSAVILLLISLSSYAASTPSPIGYWQTINKDTNRPSSIIKIYPAKSTIAGKATSVINGKILGTYLYGEKRKEPAPRCKKCDGKLENTPIVGLPIITNFKQTGKNSWHGGTLLSPRTGSTYENVTLSLANNNQLLRVHVKVGFFSQTEVWHRISLPLIKEIKQSEKQADFKLLMQ